MENETLHAEGPGRTATSYRKAGRWLSWLELRSIHREVAGLIPDSQPGGAHMGGNQLMFLAPHPRLSKINLEAHIKSQSGPQPHSRRELLGQDVGDAQGKTKSSETNPGGRSDLPPSSLVPASKRLSNEAQGHKATNK